MGDCQCRKRKQGKRDSNIEVQNEVVEVEVPRLCAVQDRPTFRTAEDIVFDDVPGDDDEFAIREAIDTDDRNL